MKKPCKRLLSIAAVVLVLSVAMTMATAANSLTITEVNVLDINGNVVETYSAANLDDEQNLDINVQTSQILSVTATMTTDDASVAVANAATTFLSYTLQETETDNDDTTSPTLSNDTIQFIDQVNTSSDGTATFTFRPRTTPGVGTYIAKSGGAAVTTVDKFSYDIIADLPNITVTGAVGADQSIERGRAAAISFTVADADDTDEINFDTVNPVASVKLGGVALTAETQYTYENGVLTLTKDYLDDLAIGNYTMVVSMTNFNQFVLTDAVIVSAPEVTEGDTASVTEGVNNAITLPAVGEKPSSIDVETAVTGESGDIYNLEYTVTDNAKVEDGKISLKDNVPFGKVVITVNVEGAEPTTEPKTVYLFTENAPTPTFGNVGLHTTSGGDAFAGHTTQEEFANMVNSYSDKLADITTALNIAINDNKKTELPHFTDALDFDYDGKFSLAEYRIYKLMMDGDDPVHTYAAVQAARPTKPATPAN